MLKELPSFLLPKYFHWHIMRVYQCCLQRVFTMMSKFIQSGDWFVKALALCSVQLYGDISSCPLSIFQRRKGIASPSLAAGLPHFANGFMRAWGRDTFISLRGLFLVTGRYSEALHLISTFGACLRHGLIPNLLGSCEIPRYNSRDASWWWLQALQDYCSFVYGDKLDQIVEFLQATTVERLFPHNDQYASYYSHDYSKREPVVSSLADLILEILQNHAQGIHFREWNAGPELDMHMTSEGFNVAVHLDPNTGFIFGGSQYNCGTWMDKMGESTQFATRGIPATPRDGAAVELIGLLASTLRWLVSLTKFGFVQSVKLITGDFTFETWYNLVKRNFENYFWIPLFPHEDSDANMMNSSLIYRRGIYKDTLNPEIEYTAYQFRPNQLVAMVVAPELFVPAHAVSALELITSVLVSTLGIRTLDPEDWAYRGDYFTDDTSSAATAAGFNYHQGPVSIILNLPIYYLFFEIFF